MCGIQHAIRQGFSSFITGITLRETEPLQCIKMKELKLKRLVECGDELCNVASNAVYQQIYVAYNLFIFKIFIIVYISILLLRPHTSKQRLAHTLRKHTIRHTFTIIIITIISHWIHIYICLGTTYDMHHFLQHEYNEVLHTVQNFMFCRAPALINSSI